MSAGFRPPKNTQPRQGRQINLTAPALDAASREVCGLDACGFDGLYEYVNVVFHSERNGITAKTGFALMAKPHQDFTAC